MKKNIVFFLLSLLVFSCGKKDDDFNLDDSSATIKFSPAETKWSLREAPDSIRIQLSGGETPYVIKERPSFSSKAIIRGNELLIFPTFNPNGDPSDWLGYDFINIADNVGNTNTFNIQVSYQEYYYTDLDFSIRSINDTTIDLSTLKFESAEYDGYWNILSIRYESAVNNTSLAFDILDIDNKGTFRPMFFVLRNYSNAFGQRQYNQIDSNQVINITKFSLKEIVGNYTILAKTQSNQETTLSGSFHLKQTGQKE